MNFKEGVHLINNKAHLTPEGSILIRSLAQRMNYRRYKEKDKD